MKCPNCGSDNCHYVSNTKVHSRGFGTGEACCGFLLMGPIGLLCGLCGMDTDSTVKEYWVCENCGNKFSQRKAEKYMKIEEQKLKNILFYREVQKKSVVEPFETEMGKRIDEGIECYLREIFPKQEIVIANPPLENQELEAMKETLGLVLKEKDMVYLVIPQMRLVIADKGLIYNNTLYKNPGNFCFHKSSVYFNQNCMITASREQAEGLCGFFTHIYEKKNLLSDDDSEDKPCEYKDYVKLLEKLQTLEEENSKKPQHFSSQPEYAQFVAKLSADAMKKFEETDPASYKKYQDLICEDHEKNHREIKYVTWSWITALIVFVFIWVNIGFMRGAGCALIVGLPISIIAFFRSVGRDSRTSEVLPDTLREVIEEENRDNINKTGKIKVSDYLDIIKDW
ncbi:MAG: hypothetical protein PUI16_00035 [Clostridia bacterium]|nr:hypothetical protein [Clostridia bacterium]MDY5554868.1 hypothetical protein [Blautia sp.]